MAAPRERPVRRLLTRIPRPARGLALGALLLAGAAAALLAAAPAAAGGPAARLVLCERQADCPAGWFCQAGACQTSPALGDDGPLFAVGVPPLLAPKGGGDTRLAEKVTQTLRRTLEMAGPFRVVKERVRALGPALEAPTPTGWDADSWHQEGVFALLFGALWTARGGGFVLEARLYEVETGQSVRISTEHQEISAAGLRPAVERIANAIIEHYTGRPGLLGTRIACTRRSPQGNKEIVTLDLTGEVEEVVTNNGSINLLPAWAPDGALAWTSYRDGNPDLWLGDRKVSSHQDLNTGAAFSPDGKVIALTLAKDGDSEVYLIERETGAIVQRLTHHPAIDTSPTWAPDGKRLAFVSDRIGAPQIYVVNRDGSGLRALTSEGYNTNPNWSPTEDVVVYDRLITAERSDIYRVDVTTGEIGRLTANPWSSEDPAFSPDGRQIVFSSNRGGEFQLFVMTADGGNVRRLTLGPGPYGSPAWSPPLRILEANGHR